MRFNTKTGEFQAIEARFHCYFGLGEAVGLGSLFAGAGSAATFAAGAGEGILTIPAAASAFTAADAIGLGATGLAAAEAGTAGAGGAAGSGAAPGSSTTIPSSMVQPTAFTPGGTGTTLPGTQGPPATSSLSTPNGTAFGSPTSGGASASSAPTLPGISGNPDLSTSLLTPDQGVAQAGIPSIGPSGGSIGTINPAPSLPGLDGVSGADAQSAFRSLTADNGISGPQISPSIVGGQATPTGIAPADGGGSFLHDAGQFAKSYGQPLVAGLGLANNLLQPQTLPQSGQLTAQANQLTDSGTQLQSYLTSGTLPPGVKTAIDSATKSAQAAIRSKYAANGMSGSTAETQELAQAELSSANQGTQIALQLLNTGIDEVGLSSKIYEQLMSANTAQNNATGSAIANLASALGGGTKVGNTGFTISQNN